ncbi:MAG: META domain-containing protein [Ignavibacteriaceae bacterium]
MYKSFFFLLFATLFLGSCSTGNLPTQINGSEWNVISILGKTLYENKTTKNIPYLSFSDNGKLFGSTGCNSFTGFYKLKGASLSISPGSITKMACPENTEQSFLNAIKQATSYKFDGDKLILLNGTKTVMTLILKEN